MQVSTKFTIAIHILSAVTYFNDSQKVTSEFLAGSVGTNPVIIRNIMSQLSKAGIIDIKRGPGGITITRPLEQITFLDIYRAVETNSDVELFRFHGNTSQACPIGSHIHQGMTDSLTQIQIDFENDLKKYTVAQVYDKTVAQIKK